MKTRSKTRPALIALGTVLALAVGAGATAFALHPVVPASLAEADAPREAPVAAQQFLDERAVQLSVAPPQPVEVPAPSGGTLTSWGCTPGGELASGAAVAKIDGRPIIALATSVPLWRDLALGDDGEDVAALQQELVRLGFPLTADGELGGATVDALAELFERAGDDEAVDRVEKARLVWIPAPSATISTCDATLGAAVDPGAPLVTLGSVPASATVMRLPSDLSPGERMLRVDGETFPVDADGTVSDPAARAGIAATVTFRSAQATDGTIVIPASLVLAEATEVASVPPQSVFGVDGATGCVLAGGEVFAVRIVGSQLGQSFVDFGDTDVPEHVDMDPGERECS